MIINLRKGGLHYFGAILFGLIAQYFYAKLKRFDVWLALDAVSPGLLLGQAIAAGQFYQSGALWTTNKIAMGHQN